MTDRLIKMTAPVKLCREAADLSAADWGGIKATPKQVMGVKGLEEHGRETE